MPRRSRCDLEGLHRLFLHAHVDVGRRQLEVLLRRFGRRVAALPRRACPSRRLRSAGAAVAGLRGRRLRLVANREARRSDRLRAIRTSPARLSAVVGIPHPAHGYPRCVSGPAGVSSIGCIDMAPERPRTRAGVHRHRRHLRAAGIRRPHEIGARERRLTAEPLGDDGVDIGFAEQRERARGTARYSTDPMARARPDPRRSPAPRCRRRRSDTRRRVAPARCAWSPRARRRRRSRPAASAQECDSGTRLTNSLSAAAAEPHSSAAIAARAATSMHSYPASGLTSATEQPRMTSASRRLGSSASIFCSSAVPSGMWPSRSSISASSHSSSGSLPATSGVSSLRAPAMSPRATSRFTSSTRIDAYRRDRRQPRSPAR